MPQDTPALTPLSAIDTHPRLQPRGGVGHSTIKAYTAAMKKGDVFPPLTLGRIRNKLYVIDGHHRLEAARLARLPTVATITRNFRSLDAAHREALKCNQAHGKPMTNAEKQHAFRAYIEAGLHLYTEDDFPHLPGTVKSVRLIASECPVYGYQHVSRKLKELGIEAPRDDTKPHYASYGGWNGPTEEELAEDEAIQLGEFQRHLDAASASYGLLSEVGRIQALNALRTLLNALGSIPAEGTATPLSI